MSIPSIFFVTVFLDEARLKPLLQCFTTFAFRCKKLRTNMKGRRASKKKLRVLRTYAHDPLTSNDETGDVSRHSTHHDVDNLTLDNQMMENLAIRGLL